MRYKNGMQGSKLQSLSHRILNFVLKKTRNGSPFPTGKCYEGEGLYCLLIIHLFIYLFIYGHGYASFSFYAYMHLTMENWLCKNKVC